MKKNVNLVKFYSTQRVINVGVVMYAFRIKDTDGTNIELVNLNSKKF